MGKGQEHTLDTHTHKSHGKCQNINELSKRKKICELEDKNFEITYSEGNKEWKRVKKAYMNYGVPSKEIIGELLGFQKEKGEESLFKENNSWGLPKSGERFRFPSTWNP